jgi:hypothetical protein
MIAVLVHPLLAHQGGWDEILLTAALVLGMLGVSRYRRRSGRAPHVTSPTATDRFVCGYCGASLAPTDVRCPSCGFRTHPTEGEADPPRPR